MNIKAQQIQVAKSFVNDLCGHERHAGRKHYTSRLHCPAVTGLEPSRTIASRDCGKHLRIILADQATIVGSVDDWVHTDRADALIQMGANLYIADFASAKWRAGSDMIFNLFLEAGATMGRG